MAAIVSTARDLIRLSLLSIGAIGQGENPSADEAHDALLILNDLLDEWNADSLTVFSIQRNVFTLPSLKQVYTLGAGGDFNTARPPRIEECYVIVNTGADSSEIPVDILGYDEWARISTKDIPSTIPRSVWPDYQFPLINLSFFPIPSAISQIVLYTWQNLSAFASLDTAISLPPAYRKALRYCLAVELTPHYERAPDAIILSLATESLGKLRRMNTGVRELTMRCDAAMNASPQAFNWLTGE